MIRDTIVAPAKVILLGGKAVNYGHPALVAAVGLRTMCTLRSTGAADDYRLASGERSEVGDRGSLREFKARVDALREGKRYDDISALAREDYFAPTRYVLAHLAERTGALGIDVSWTSEIPVGSGLGSGAAASASLVVAALRAAGASATPREVAWLAWQGDVIAHGGLGTGLDSGASALGGVARYSLGDGPAPVSAPVTPPLVIGDTLLRASTAASNIASRNWLGEHPMRMHLMAEIGMLVAQAETALRAGDLPTLGHLMNLNHLIKEKLGMSVPKTEQLIEAALGAGALGAKISGKGNGGIIVALAGADRRAAVAAAIEAAGGKAIVPEVGVEGARIEDHA